MKLNLKTKWDSMNKLEAAGCVFAIFLMLIIGYSAVRGLIILVGKIYNFFA